MKTYYFYGVDEYGNLHAFRSKGYRSELIDVDKIRPVTYAEYQKEVNKPMSVYVMLHNTNDLNTYNLVKVK